MNKKILFLDIDGTFTEPGSNTPPASALEAVKTAQANGHLVFLCTGRNYAMLEPVYKLGFDGAIGSAGGYIVYGDEIIYDCPMTEDQRLLVLNTLKDNKIFRTIECRDGAYTDEGFKIFLEENAGEGGNSELLRWRKQIEESLDIKPMADYNEEPVYKVVFMSPSADYLTEPKKILGNDFNLIIQEPDKYGITNGEIVNKIFDKGKAVKKVCEYFDISIDDSIGFGDSMNDLEMIQQVAYSVVMDNGSPTLKQMADYVAPKVTEDGLLEAFEKLKLV
jgi:Cof subfamily protein (haloacid dehalogenase superfamily)